MWLNILKETALVLGLTSAEPATQAEIDQARIGEFLSEKSSVQCLQEAVRTAVGDPSAEVTTTNDISPANAVLQTPASGLGRFSHEFADEAGNMIGAQIDVTATPRENEFSISTRSFMYAPEHGECFALSTNGKVSDYFITNDLDQIFAEQVSPIDKVLSNEVANCFPFDTSASGKFSVQFTR